DQQSLTGRARCKGSGGGAANSGEIAKRGTFDRICDGAVTPWLIGVRHDQVFAADRCAIAQASDGLRHAAGNFYVNDKPTGAVLGQQPFGGGRSSGTNDKAGSMWNLMRWVSPRAIKENFAPPLDFRYPYMEP
ncbi:MAG: hypothetical protein ACRET5_06695, partial [Steroidobacteraceae bacterium]